jgi:hypothetical protein
VEGQIVEQAPGKQPSGSDALKATLLRQVARPQPSLLDLQPLIAGLQQSWQPPSTGEALAAVLDGLWQLRYTTANALSRLGLDNLPGVERRRTYQFVDAANSRLYNLAEVELAGGLARGTLLVRAALRLGEVPRVHVHFERSALIWGGIDEFGTAEGAIRRLDAGEGVGIRFDVRSEGSVDTLYIDTDLRIALGNRGTIFILTRP